MTHTDIPRPAWQRLQCLSVLRSLAADAPLLYCLFRAYDMSIHRDCNAVHDVVRAAVDILKVRLCLLMGIALTVLAYGFVLL